MTLRIFGEAPYYSDYDETKGFHRILFRPGVAVQARELTQLQEILQNQINRFGANIFQDGSLVTGGQTQFDLRANYLVVLPTVGSGSFDPTTIVGRDLVASTADTNGIKATCKVVLVEPNGSNYNLIIKATNGGSFVASDTLNYQPDPTVSGVAFATLAASNFFGKCSTFSVNTGVFYTKGSFVLCNPATVVMAYDTETTNGSEPTVRVGLQIIENVVDSDEDSSLLDPALGFFNYNAPGADRYQIQLQLISVPLLKQAVAKPIVNDVTGAITSIQVVDGGSGYSTSNFINTAVSFFGSTLDATGNGATGQVTSVDSDTDAITSIALTNGGAGFKSTTAYINVAAPTDTLTNFLSLATFDTGLLTGLVTTSTYSIIGDTMARRTFDESGSYSVNPYVIRVVPHVSDPTKFTIKIDPGKSYVQGYELQNLATVSVDADRARDTASQASITGYSLNSYYGNYTLVEFDDIVGAFDPTQVPSLTIKDDTSATIGTCDLINIAYFSDSPLIYRFGLANVQITDPTKSFADARTLVDGSNVATISLVSGVATLNDTSSSSLFFLMPQANVKTLGDSADFAYKVTKTATVSSGAATITQTGGIQFKDVSNAINDKANGYVIFDTTAGGAVNMDNVSIATTFNGSTATATFTGSAMVNGHSLSIISTLQAENVARINKTRVEGHTFSHTPSSGDTTITLDFWDGVALTSVIGGAVDYTSRFIFDNGQRDEKYDYARLLLKPGEIMPQGALVVTYDYFSHGSTGGYFSVDSYPDYDEIPVYVTENNASIPLQNVIDFRYSPAATNPFIPDIFAEINVDFTYYLGRTDRLMLTPQGVFEVVTGHPNLNPTSPAADGTSMTLALLTIAPYTQNLNTDVTVIYADNKRYTMRDIGVLDSRITRLEYYNTLNLLEQTASQLSIPDVNGDDRFKNGTLVDSFAGCSVADVFNADYYAGIDYLNSFMTCPTVCQVQRTHVDWTTRSNVSLQNDILMLDYIPAPFITQGSASRAISVNPFNVTVFNGTIAMQPPSDFWHDITYLPNIVVNVTGENDNYVSAAQNTNLTRNGNPLVGKVKGSIPPATAAAAVYGNWTFNWNGTSAAAISQAYSTQYGGNVAAVTQLKNVINSGGVGNLGYQQQFGGPLPSGATPNQEYPGQLPVATATRTATTTSIAFQTVTQLVGDYEVNTSVIPFMRVISIYFAATGMKPSTTMFPFFDTTNIGADIVGAEVLTIAQQVGGTALSTIQPFQNAAGMATISQDQGGGTIVTGTVIMEHNGLLHVARDGTTPFSPSFAIEFQQTLSDAAGNLSTVTGNYDVTAVHVAPLGNDGSGLFRSDSSGCISGVYTVPANTFYTGDRVFRLIDNTDDNVNLAATVSDYTFSSFGLKSTNQQSYISTQVPVTTTTTTTQTELVYLDPLAESFLVDAKVYPNGVFLDSVDLCFLNKDPAIPVSVQIRTMDNGTPTSTVVPGSVVTLNSEDVNITNLDSGLLVPSFSDPNTYTNFKFPTPVCLLPGVEYALVLMSNSNAYEAYVADIGSTQLGSTQTISQQPYAGSLFESQNASTWTPIQTSDLMFRLNKCVFQTGGDCVLVIDGYSELGEFDYDILYVAGNNLNFTSVTTSDFGYKLVTAPDTRETSYTPLNIATNIYMDDRHALFADYVYVPLVSGQTVYTVPFNTVQEDIDTLDVYLTTDGGATEKLLSKASYTITPQVGSATTTLFTWTSLTNALPDSGSLRFATLSGSTISVNLTTTDTNVSPVIDLSQLSMTFVQNQINAGGLNANSLGLPADSDLPGPTITLGSTGGGTGAQLLCVVSENILQAVVIANGGSGYSNGTTATVTTSQSPSPTVTATVTLTVAGGVITNTNVTNPGSGYIAPTITISSLSGSGASIYPIVEQQDSTSQASGTVIGWNVVDEGSGYTDAWTASMVRPDDTVVPLTVFAETSPRGGNCETRYISRRVTLAEGFDAEDMVVYFNGMKPPGAEIDVYYRVLASDDTTLFEDRPYVKMKQQGDYTSSNLNDYVAFQYVTEGGTTAYDGFTSYKVFSVKIVLIAANPSQVPRVSGLSAIAVDTSYTPL